MRNIADGGRRQGASKGHSVTQVFYADGEQKSMELVQAVVHYLGAAFTHFDDVQDCLALLRTRDCHLLISNTQRPAVDGVRLLLDTRRIAPSVPVVMMVEHGDIQTAVRAMKGGAADCVERPPEKNDLISVIGSALRQSEPTWTSLKKPLTGTEEQVVRLVLKGHTTAEAAHKLHRSKRTVEVHRSHIMHKLQVDGMVNLVRKCAQLGFLKDWP